MEHTTPISRIYEVIYNFNIEGEITKAEPYGTGHINETFRISTNNSKYDYLLQRINHHIFKDIEGLMGNIKLVTEHLRRKLEDIPDSRPEQEVITLIPTHTNQFYICDNQGNYWRMYRFLETNSYDVLQTEQQAYEGGKAFGKFQRLLSDMDASLLVETIPNFHNIKIRLDRFALAIESDVVDRVKNVSSEIAFLLDRADEMRAILELAQSGKFPLRIIHNDTKFNNVLLDSNDKGQCVIDLDTVMPGYVAYDFGDAIRTIINTGSEDEKDISKIQLNIPLFKAYTMGYFKQAGSFLSEPEVESLLSGVMLMPYEQSVRFLTDYIEGDTYYKIHFPEHNLQRTRAQIQLLRKLEEQDQTLREIVHTVAFPPIHENYLQGKR